MIVRREKVIVKVVLAVKIYDCRRNVCLLSENLTRKKEEYLVMILLVIFMLSVSVVLVE